MKYIGNLSELACSKLFSTSLLSANSNLISADLSSLLRIKSFKEKAKCKSITLCESIYLTINEERAVAIISEEENPDKDYKYLGVPMHIQKLTLPEIRAFQRYDDKYVLPSTVRADPLKNSNSWVADVPHICLVIVDF